MLTPSRKKAAEPHNAPTAATSIEKPELITTGEAARLLGVSVAKVISWVKDGTLAYARTYQNRYHADCYLLDKAVVESEPTRLKLAEQIALYQRRSAGGKKGVTTRVSKERDKYEEYLAQIAEAAPTPQVATLLKAAYFLWQLNHTAKRQTVPFDRARLYSMKGKMLQALWEHYADPTLSYQPEQALELFGGRGKSSTRADKETETEAETEAETEPKPKPKPKPGTRTGERADEEEKEVTVEVATATPEIESGTGFLLKNTDLPAAARPQPAIFLTHTRSSGYYGDWRHYLGFVVAYDGFRFPFHNLWEQAADNWLPLSVKEQLAVKDWKGEGEGRDEAFTFGGRATTWLEERAISQEEIVEALTEIYQVLTGRTRTDFLEFNWQPRPRRHTRTREDWDWDEDEDH